MRVRIKTKERLLNTPDTNKNNGFDIYKSRDCLTQRLNGWCEYNFGKDYEFTLTNARFPTEIHDILGEKFFCINVGNNWLNHYHIEECYDFNTEDMRIMHLYPEHVLCRGENYVDTN